MAAAQLTREWERAKYRFFRKKWLCTVGWGQGSGPGQPRTQAFPRTACAESPGKIHAFSPKIGWLRGVSCLNKMLTKGYYARSEELRIYCIFDEFYIIFILLCINSIVWCFYLCPMICLASNYVLICLNCNMIGYSVFAFRNVLKHGFASRGRSVSSRAFKIIRKAKQSRKVKQIKDEQYEALL